MEGYQVINRNATYRDLRRHYLAAVEGICSNEYPFTFYAILTKLADLDMSLL